MCRFRLHTVLLLTGISICGGSASAQLFGDRNIRPNRRPQATNSAAMITGSERFVRGNRTADDFVGAGTSATGTFVGATPPATIGRVTGTVVGPTEEPATQVNVPRSRAAAGLYAERLTINFEPRAGEGLRAQRQLLRRVRGRERTRQQVQVSVAAGGEVAAGGVERLGRRVEHRC